MKIQGYLKPKKEEPKPDLIKEVGSVVELVKDLKDTKVKIIEEADKKMGEVDEKIKEVSTSLSSSQEELATLAEETRESIDELKEDAIRYITENATPGAPGDPGKDADEENILERVIARLPKEDALVSSILEKVPKTDEDALLKKFLKNLPKNKASLKIIQKSFEVDPMSVIDKIMQMPAGTFKLKSENIDGLEQTIRAFHNQLGRGYLHGGGISNITGLVLAGTNVTITGSGTATSPYVINASGGGGISFGTVTQIPFMNAANDDFDYSSAFAYDGSKLILTAKDIASSGARVATGYFTDLNVAASGALTFVTVGSKNISIAQATISFNDSGAGAAIRLVGANMSGGNQTITLPDATGTVALTSDIPDNLTDFTNQTAWRIFYSNGSGDVIELALGASGTFLQSNGAAAIPSWAVPAGSGDVSKVGTPVDNQVAVWTGDGTIEGTSGFTYDGANLLLTGDIGATATRITKGWFTDLQVTNAIAGSITGNAATVTVGDAGGDTTTFVMLATDATGSLSPKTDAGLTYNTTTNALTATTFIGALTGNADTATNVAVGGITGLGTGVATALAINVGSAGAFVTFNGALGTPSSGTVTNLTGTASININGTVGATTPAAGTFTIVTVDNLVIDLNTISSTSGNLNITPVSGSAIVLDGTISVDAGVVTGITSLGVTGTRVTAGFFTDLTVTNAIAGSITGTAAVATTVTVADEATDTTCFITFTTAATGNLGVKSNANMTFNSNTGVATFASTVLTTTDINGGTVDGTVIGGASAAAGTFTTIVGSNIAVNTTTIPAEGMYRPTGAGNLGFSVSGAAELLLTSTAFSPAVDGGNSLGTTALGWQNLFGNTGFVINIENSDWVATHSAGILTVGTGDLRVTTAGTNAASVVTVGGTQTLTAKTLTSPTITTSPTAAGATWTDLGTVTTADINGGTLDGVIIGGASAAAATVTTLTVNTNANPDANDGAGLGTGALGWSDLFLASGALINFANGDAVITHSAGVITISTGDLRITTAGTNSASAVTVGGTQTLTAKTLTSPTINTPTLGGHQTMLENAAFLYDPVLSADGTYNGDVRAGTAGTALAFGDLIYLAAADSRWELTDANAAATSGDVFIGMCVLAAAGDGSATIILLRGMIRADAAFPALTISGPAYVGTTAGDIQVAQPSGTDDVIRRVGFAWTADELYFNPSNDYVTHT